VRPGDRGGHRDAVDGGAEGAGDVDPGSFSVGASPARAPGQPGGPAQLADQRLAFLVGFAGGGGVPGAVGGGEFVVQFADAAAVAVAGGGIQQWPGVRGGQPGAAGHEVECWDFAAGGGEQGAQVVQAAAVAQPGVLGSGVQQPVFAITAQAPLAGRRGEPVEQPWDC
jgi:hypothetical protein